MERHPDLGIIIMTGYQNLATVVDASRRHAYTYLIKPFQIDQMVALMERITRERALLRENRLLREAIDERDAEIRDLRARLEAASTAPGAPGESLPRGAGANLQAIRSYQRQQRSTQAVPDSAEDDGA